MRCQNCIYIAILAFFLFINYTSALHKIPSLNAREIVYYSLFNYDNLIADYYESPKHYQNSLASFIADNTKLDIKIIQTLLNTSELNSVTSPIKYMKTLNKMLENSYNITFLYDY